MPIRSFIAVEIADDIRARLAEAQDALRAAGGDVRWSKPENLHVTLKFLGEISEANVGAACTIVEQVATAHSAFGIQLAGLGAFPSARRPRVVFAELIDASQTLFEMARELDKAMAEIGVERERKPFRSHLTLGRVKSPRGLAELTQAMSQRAQTQFGSQTVSRIVLMRSDLKPSGAVYSRVGAGQLAP